MLWRRRPYFDGMVATFPWEREGKRGHDKGKASCSPRYRTLDDVNIFRRHGLVP